jgi:error-prone DNA polymerase
MNPRRFCGALLNSQPMGFYAPAQLVQDARRHDVEVLSADVTVSAWDCTLEQAALRLGVAHGRRPVRSQRAAHRRRSPGRALRASWPISRTARKLNRHDLGVLGCCGAHWQRSRGHRHAAAWDVAGVEKLPPLPRGYHVRRSARRAGRADRRTGHRRRLQARSASRWAGIRWRCCAASCARDG